jgi:hypothetical protein
MRHVIVTEDCWLWRREVKGVPRLRVDGRLMPATHVAWRCAYGEWPRTTRRWRVERQCGNLRCVRPRHLALLTPAQTLALRSARLELVLERHCRYCEGPFLVRRSMALKGWGLYCSRGCYRRAA